MKNYRDTGTPAFEPVTLDDLVAWLNLDSEDAALEMLLASGIDHIENEVEVRLAARTGEFRFDGFGDRLELGVTPVTAVASVTYLDADRVRQTLDPDQYLVALKQLVPVISPVTNWPTHAVEPGSVVVTGTVGYADGEVPPALKQAVAVYAADQYLNREGKSESAATIERLVKRFRRGSF